MIERVKKSALSAFTLLAACMLAVLFAAGSVAGSEYGEESPDAVMPYDDVLTGKVDDFSDRVLYVEGMGYRYCKSIKIFNPRNRMVPLENIEGAVEVKVFVNKGCIRKIKVLRFAQ